MKFRRVFAARSAVAMILALSMQGQAPGAEPASATGGNRLTLEKSGWTHS